MPMSAVMVTKQVVQCLAWPHPHTPITVPRYRSFTLWQGFAGAQEFKIVLAAVHPTAEHLKSRIPRSHYQGTSLSSLPMLQG